MTQLQKNKDLVSHAVEAIWNRDTLASLKENALTIVDEVIDSEYVCHMQGGQDIVGLDAYRKAVANFKESLPNVNMRIEDQVAEGDEVVTTMVMEGKHEGRLKTRKGTPDLEATGNPISVRGVSRVLIKNGKVVEEWVSWDEQTAMESVGALGFRPSYE